VKFRHNLSKQKKKIENKIILLQIIVSFWYVFTLLLIDSSVKILFKWHFVLICKKNWSKFLECVVCSMNVGKAAHTSCTCGVSCVVYGKPASGFPHKEWVSLLSHYSRPNRHSHSFLVIAYVDGTNQSSQLSAVSLTGLQGNAEHWKQTTPSIEQFTIGPVSLEQLFANQ